jgi:hypothetical protein
MRRMRGPPLTAPRQTALWCWADFLLASFAIARACSAAACAVSDLFSASTICVLAWWSDPQSEHRPPPPPPTASRQTAPRVLAWRWGPRPGHRPPLHRPPMRPRELPERSYVLPDRPILGHRHAHQAVRRLEQHHGEPVRARDAEDVLCRWDRSGPPELPRRRGGARCIRARAWLLICRRADAGKRAPRMCAPRTP